MCDDMENNSADEPVTPRKAGEKRWLVRKTNSKRRLFLQGVVQVESIMANLVQASPFPD